MMMSCVVKRRTVLLMIAGIALVLLPSFSFLRFETFLLDDISVMHNGTTTLKKLYNKPSRVARSSSPSASKATIAYAITVTKCSSSSTVFLDGAAVLAYSIHKQSIRNDKADSRYDYKLYAFLHKQALDCAKPLAQLGYNVQVRPLPVKRKDIQGPLKDYVDGAGCCGPKEFLKLYAFTLMDHPVAVHLDIDMLLLKPLDDLFDTMLDGPDSPARTRIPSMWTRRRSNSSSQQLELPKTIDAFFTRDYNMMIMESRTVQETALQGGFLVVRPNLTTFSLLRDIIREGDYDPNTGWGHSKGLRFGGFYGAPQVQGLCAYISGHVSPDTWVELDRCRINTMVDSPYANAVDDGQEHEGKCREPEYCDDCRLTHLDEISLAHFTICQKPWLCSDLEYDFDDEERRLCSAFHNLWFRHRHELEMKWTNNVRSSYHNIITAVYHPEQAQKTYCVGKYENRRYVPILYPNTTMLPFLRGSIVSIDTKQQILFENVTKDKTEKPKV